MNGERGGGVEVDRDREGEKGVKVREKKEDGEAK